jgi:enamine deaminase RidA (YjgF/YER057c/UK114 family)
VAAIAAVAFLIAVSPMAAAAADRKPADTEREVFHLRELEVPFGYSQAVRVGDTIHVSGSVSMDASGQVLGKGDMAAQLRNAYEDIRKSLAHFGATFGDVVEETIYTTDMDKLLASAGAVRADVYKGADYPAGSWVGVTRLVSPDYLVEVSVTAVRRPKPRS